MKDGNQYIASEYNSNGFRSLKAANIPVRFINISLLDKIKGDQAVRRHPFKKAGVTEITTDQC
jgi:hypothetical protein